MASDPSDIPVIPEHATVKYTTSYAVPTRGPFADATINNHGGVIYSYMVTQQGRHIDMTEEYHQYMETQPKIHRVVYEWTDPPSQELHTL